MLALLIILCSGAILCFFSQEFLDLLKRIFAVKGATTILPLALASSIIYYNLDLVLFGLYSIHAYLRDLLHWIMYLIPYKSQAHSIAMIIELVLISVVPVLLLNAYSYRKTHKPYPYPYWTSTFLWLFSVILLLVL